MNEYLTFDNIETTFSYILTYVYVFIPREEDLSALRKRLDNRLEKYISSELLCDLAEVVLKNNNFKVGKKKIKAKKRGCNWKEICTSLQYSGYGRTRRKNSSKGRN